MSYYIIEVDPLYVGDDDSLHAFLRIFGASGGTLSLRSDTVGSATHIVVYLPGSKVNTGMNVVDGPLSAAGARSYLNTNGW